ncbi:hypothetical protein BO82DRAFT_116272 [Aspergillus uvarum CBS 121591]|uniref:Uncharacterized protein n=1 Tax=Aspergillus uvarum CBS 121591 TaxID=1448315 RepID=A0A319CKM8_9EURO|nr:hypothetical protein BO82DRAFT_116272 [Aspergillus uvarum CBS 121591]PYH86135.1 hypothetical protein BO82DRAFT_116272 [Aspergillus uvarum CBS 121591]
MTLGVSVALHQPITTAPTANLLNRLDKSCIFLSATQTAGDMTYTTGKFCLSLPEAIWVKTIKVRFVGRLKMLIKPYIDDRRPISPEYRILHLDPQPHHPFRVHILRGHEVPGAMQGRQPLRPDTGSGRKPPHPIECDCRTSSAGYPSISASRTQSLFKETQSLVGESGSVSCTGTEWAVSSRKALPRSVSLCSQSVRTKMIAIDHALEVRAEFRDRRGRLFDTIVASIPLSIYMTPRVLGPDGSICDKVLEYGTCPSPPYERHTSQVRLLDASEVMDGPEQCTMSIAGKRLDGQELHRFQFLELAAPCYKLATGCDPPVYTL